jgi:hypothetical protein
MKQITYLSVAFGADPEFFFQNKDGSVVGAEKILPKEGVGNTTSQYKTIFTPNGWQYVTDEKGERTIEVVDSGPKLIIIDGVQAEFNVLPNHCRQSFSSNLSVCFRKTAEHIIGKDIVASFAQTVTVDKDEMESLSRESQQFGCAPSKNAYGNTKVAIKDASKYYSRSAGGHVHIGYGGSLTVQKVLKNTDITVPILDIIVGNTCVLLDRDPGNIERRKNYGRAGEFRLPKHGLEYRTLSNFWLRSYQTMSLVLALVRFAVSVAGDDAVSKELLGLVDIEDIAKAINENDAVLAQKNFDKIKDFIASIGAVGSSENWFPLQGSRMARFEFFAKKGLDHWFKDDIMAHWVKHDYHVTNGWEQFLDRIVAKKMPSSLVGKATEAIKDHFSPTLTGINSI